MPTRMDASVGHQLLERQPRDLAPDRVEAGDHDGVRCVVDHHVNAGGQLKRADVPAFSADDTTLHFVARERHGGHRNLRGVLGGNPLDGERHDFLGLAFRVALRRFPNLPKAIRRVGLSLGLHALHQLSLGLLL